MSMQKSMKMMIQLLTAGMLLAGIALAQTPAAPSTPSTQPAAAQGAAPPKTAPPSTTKKSTTTAAKPATALPLKTQKDKASYAVGMSIGTGLKRQALPVDPAVVARGLRDAMTGAKPLMTEDQLKEVLTQLQTDMRAKQQAKSEAAASGNKKLGDAFMSENKAKDGVVTLPSGLQYKVLTAGTGPKPTASDTVSCNYKGTLIDGTEFDSSYKRGEAASFPVGGVIKGWTEALQLMPVGSKWQLVIPSDLAYGDAGRPGIPPGSTLVFEVELLSIGEQKK
jgi:FKBP-type peptidyl-prolyl cis-trans isomerase FklB